MARQKPSPRTGAHVPELGCSRFGCSGSIARPRGGHCRVQVAAASLDELRVLARAPRSAPCPGIANEHWAHSGEFATRTLHEAYLAVLDVNDGILVFVPKAALRPGLDEHRAVPKDLRPLGSTAHKAIMLLLNGVLARIAEDVHPSQRGFVRGRDLLTNVAKLDGAVTEFLHDDESEPAAVLPDVAAVLPESAEWEYILLGIGCAASPSLSCRRTVCDVWAGPRRYLNGRTTSIRLAVTRGIRQVCPASGSVWALLYDPAMSLGRRPTL